MKGFAADATNGYKYFMKHEVRVYNDPNEDMEDDLRPEYDFDHSKAKSNPYADQAMRRKTILQEADLTETVTTSEQVNQDKTA